MKKILGLLLLVIAMVIVLVVVAGWVFWSLSLAVRLVEPVLFLGGAIILALVGIYLRGDQ